jgi:hypothetical protein
MCKDRPGNYTGHFDADIFRSRIDGSTTRRVIQGAGGKKNDKESEVFSSICISPTATPISAAPRTTKITDCVLYFPAFDVSNGTTQREHLETHEEQAGWRRVSQSEMDAFTMVAGMMF